MTQAPGSRQDDLYREAASAFGDGLERLAHAYEADPDTRRDLLQDIHLALWRSFAVYDGRCSQRTWAYRVAHNTAASHVTRWVRQRRLQFTTLEEADGLADAPLERAGDVIGLVGGVIMSLRIHRLNLHHPAPDALGLEGVRAYRASLERLRIANDISWQTIMILQAAFALPLVAVAVERRPNALLVVVFQLSILVFVSASALRYRAYGVRLRRQIEELDETPNHRA